MVETVVAHELGHLLGGGHYDIDQNNYLFPDSHSFQRVDSIVIPEVGYIEWTVQTLITSEADCAIDPFSNPKCVMTDYFSSILPGREGDANHNNLRAVQKTALSAANFRPIVESRPPVLKPPINLEFSFKVKDCDPAPYTSHWLIWQDHPDTTVEVDKYEVWYFQPPRNGYIYGWDTDTPSSPGYGVGAEAIVKVKACTSSECSALSSSTYVAAWTCRG